MPAKQFVVSKLKATIVRGLSVPEIVSLREGQFCVRHAVQNQFVLGRRTLLGKLLLSSQQNTKILS